MEMTIKKPVITEKATRLSDKRGAYTFKVEKTADKTQIKKAVEEMYNVTVVSVNTMIVKGKNKSRYTKAGLVKGKTSDYKKAIVVLKEGDTIDFFSNI